MTDSGAADPRLSAALAGWRTAPDEPATAEVLAALPGARVFAAVTATSTADHVDGGTGLRAESAADMALVTLVRGSERALPVFTSTDTLRRWRGGARPVPVSGDRVCGAALEQGAATLLLDLDFAVTGSHLQSLAQGFVPVVGSSLAARRTTEALVTPMVPPAAGLVRAVAAALTDERVRAARLLEGPGGPVLGVVVPEPLTATELAELARRLVVRLGSALPAAGLDLAVVPVDGPGIEVYRRRRGWQRRDR